jgi:hypothetical protein
MSSKIIASVVAGGLLVGAGFVTSIVSAPGAAVAQEQVAETEGKGFFGRGLAFLGEVLDELVGEGTIEAGDAEAVLNAVEEKAEAKRAELQELRDQIEGFLEDGVLTEDEFSQLPEENPFANEKFDEAWEDGELTKEEIRSLRPHPRRDAFKRGAHFGALLDDGGIDETEWSEIPDDSPLKQIDGIEDYFEDDGLITLDELREIREEHRPFQPMDDTAA